MTVAVRSDLASAVVDATRSIVGHDASVQLHEPRFGGNELAYVTDCIETGWVSSVGAYVDRFERMVADAAEVDYAIATVNGTAALHVSMLLAGVKPGDEVLAPALTFVATINAIAYANATPHFIDSSAETFGICPEKLEAHLQAVATVKDGVCINRQTGAVIRAVCPMHVFGRPVDMDGLSRLAERWGIAVIEDAAEALGSRYKGRRCGGLARLGAFSFNGNKIATTGGGGAITTNDPEVARRAKHVTTTARLKHNWEFLHDEIGFNYRLPNLNAALGCAQLERLEDALVRKRRLAARYREVFAGIPGVSIAEDPADSEGNEWLIAALLDAPDMALRDQVLTALNDNGIMARPIWTLMHRLPMFSACPRMDLSEAERLEARVINLPSSPFLSVD